MEARVLKAVEFLQKKVKKAKIAIVLGSGLSSFPETLDQQERIPYSDIPEFPRSTVHGHPGNFISASIQDIPLYILQGRFHYYEGKSLQDVTFPIRVLKKLGIEILILTNAAGILNDDYKVGEFMLLRDHLNLLGDNPLRGRNLDEWGPRFPSLSYAYDEELRKTALAVGKESQMIFHEGVYAACSGPSYETPAEIKMLKLLGADAVGMSTVPEVIVARHQGTRVCAISCLTNYTSAEMHKDVTHKDVLENAAKVSETFSRFMSAFVVKVAHG